MINHIIPQVYFMFFLYEICSTYQHDIQLSSMSNPFHFCMKRFHTAHVKGKYILQQKGPLFKHKSNKNPVEVSGMIRDLKI